MTLNTWRGDSVTKVKIKLGAIEVDYEGEPEFLTSGFYELLNRLQDLSSKIPQQPPAGHPGGHAPPGAPLQMTVKTIATKLNASSGSDLALAAMCSLHFGKSMPKYKRGEVLTEMKAATGIYKPSMSKNLSHHLRSLLNDGKIVEAEPEVYALTPATETPLRQQLAVH